MEDFIGFIFVWFFMELVFWGLAYITGFILTPIISLGNWAPDSLNRNQDSGKIIKAQSGIKLIKYSGKTYLGAWGVAFLGLTFWVAVLLVFIFV